MVRRAIETLYNDRCTVTVRRKYQKANKATDWREVVIISDQPCKLSFYNTISRQSPTAEEVAAYSVEQRTKLFLAPELDVPPGSKISVFRNGKSFDYCQSGSPAFFPTHQEITLELFQKWA